jgi:hypothetical protein
MSRNRSALPGHGAVQGKQWLRSRARVHACSNKVRLCHGSANLQPGASLAEIFRMRSTEPPPGWRFIQAGDPALPGRDR